MSERKRISWWRRWSSYFAAKLRGGVQRVRGALVPNAQAAVFATIGWAICFYGFKDPNPIFAPIATYVCMGFTRNRELRKVAEMGAGATTGVLIGNVVAHYFGFGIWQLLLLLLLTPMIGRLMDRSDLVTFQTGMQSIVVASMIGTAALGESVGSPFDRAVSAIVGSLVALLATVILPTDVRTRPTRMSAYVLDELSGTMRALAKGLANGDSVWLTRQFGRLRSIRESLTDARTALSSAEETASVSPAAMRSRRYLAELDRMLELAERLHVTLSMIQRQSRHMVTECGPMPDIAEPMRQASYLLEEISLGLAQWRRPVEAREAAMELAVTLAPQQVVTDGDWRSLTLLSLVRSTVVDLLELTGLSMAQARAVLADTGEFDPEDPCPVHNPADSASDIWGTDRLPAVKPPEDHC